MEYFNELRRLTPASPSDAVDWERIGALLAATSFPALGETPQNPRFHGEGEYVRPEEAIAGILGGGGIPVLAHPSFGDGDQLIIGEEMEARLQRLIGFGLQGVEAFYSGFSPKLRNEMLRFASRFELYVTAGSDYHGKNKLVELGDTGLDESAPPVPGMKRFLAAVLD